MKKKQKTERVRKPKQVRSKTKVKKVLEAGRKCFVKLGYAKTTMVKIAKEAGVSTGTTYSYFKDKNDVLKKILKEHVENILQPAEAVMDSLNEKSSLRSTLKKLIMTALDSPEDVGMDKIFHEQIMKDKELQALAAGYRDRGLDICKKLVQQFGNKKAKKDLEASAQIVVGLLDYCTHVNTLFPTNIPREKACEIGIAMIIAYFK